jgi:hypothetical protein
MAIKSAAEFVYSGLLRLNGRELLFGEEGELLQKRRNIGQFRLRNRVHGGPDRQGDRAV